MPGAGTPPVRQDFPAFWTSDESGGAQRSGTYSRTLARPVSVRLRADEVEGLMNTAHRAGIVGLRTAFERAARMRGGQVRFAAMPGVRRLAYRRRASWRSATAIGAPSITASTARCSPRRVRVTPCRG